MIEDQLTPALEQIEQAYFAIGSVKDILLVDRDHWQPAALRGERIERACHRFLFYQQFLPGGLPLIR